PMSNRSWSILVVSLLFVSVACGGGGTSERDAANSNQPPAGCKTTLCDYDRAGCDDPEDLCKKCLDTCDTFPIESQPDCVQACDSLCSRPTNSPCDAQLKACRTTPRNSMCADDLPPVQHTTGTGAVSSTTAVVAT